jgi:hypothetical protein
VAGISREQPNLKIGVTAERKADVQKSAQSSLPVSRLQRVVEAGIDFFLRMGCKMHLWHPVEAEEPSRSAQGNT